MEWQYITAVKCFLTLSSGDIQQAGIDAIKLTFCSVQLKIAMASICSLA